ncbi:phage tail protein [Limosilactobacillus portuensis]|uniref:phage tail protein n=1 Tax=Limosilactobacillus portuensis TaxID=2742601 RepID=UPI0023586935|nr:phage tail protein [Limosilactobacillus portuensis]WCT60180.1 phage tail protein [Limosilactobacillus portuensis]
MTYALIRSHDGKAEEQINFADLYNTWSREFALSQTFQVSFTMRYLPGFEYVFNLAKIQAEVLFNGQVYKIKEVEPITSEQGVVTNKITAVNALIDKLRNLRLPEANKDSNSSAGDSSNDNQQPGTVIQRAQADQTYSLDSVMHQFFDNNDQGIRYELHGQFIDQPAQAQGSCFDYLTSNLAAFGGYWIPDGNTLKIYDLPSLTHKTGETFRYIYHSPNVDIQSSSTDMVNSVQYQAGKMEKTVTTGDDNTPVTKNAQGVIDYARSWLGVPYILGGRTTAGTDCAGFVHFVYAKFGIDIGWTTWSQESSFHEVSTPQTGDVGFYGAHGNPYHICLFLDANTIIFEPQPGEVCKEEPASWYYPSWIARNDQMAAIVSGGGNADDSGSSSSTTEFYQLSGTYKNQDSIDKYDEHRGEVQTLDTLYDQNAVNNWLENHLQVEPATTMTWTHKDNFHYELGDSIHTIDPELNVDTDMVIFSYTVNDFNPVDATINFNNTGKAMKDINAILLKSITNINTDVGNTNFNGATGGRRENHFNNMVLLTKEEQEKIKKFVDS